MKKREKRSVLKNIVNKLYVMNKQYIMNKHNL